MSTKIYNGYKIHLEENNIECLNQFCNKVRDKIKNKIIQAYKKIYIQLILNEYDDRLVGLSNDQSNILYKIRGYISKEYQNIDQGYRNSYDLGFNFVLFDRSPNLLCIVYTCQQELLNVFSKMPGVIEYGYWDNSDKPKNIKTEEWEQRKSDWQFLTENHEIPEYP